MSSTPTLFDRKLLRLRRRRAAALGAADFLVRHAADELAGRLSLVVRHFDRAVDLGALTADICHALVRSGKVGTVISVSDMTRPDSQVLQAVADEEAFPFADQSLDLVVSVLALQFVNDLPGTLAQVRRALKPDGLFMAGMIGGDTLTELRDAFADAESELEGGASPRVAPFADVRQLGTLLQRAGFALPVVDAERLTVRYDSAYALMQDLRRMGATNALVERRRTPLRRATLARMLQNYADKFSDPDGRVRATFEIIWLSGWAPHESQQKPLKPGSARHRLADALGAHEISAGEKPKA